MRISKFLLILFISYIFFSFFIPKNTNKIYNDFNFKYKDNKIISVHLKETNEVIATDIEEIYFVDGQKMYIITKSQYIVVKTNINEIIKVNNLDDLSVSDKHNFEKSIQNKKAELKKQEELDKIFLIIAPVLIILIPILILRKI